MVQNSDIPSTSERHASTFAIIMAGGAGTRFWPASRELKPKQLLALSGKGESLLTQTIRRIARTVPLENIYVVTAKRLLEATRLDAQMLSPEQILAEPAPRNTAPCIAWASAVIHQKNPEALCVVLPSDHAIQNEEEFSRVMSEALSVAEQRSCIVTLGITPNRAETGYGYIEKGEAIPKHAFAIKRFVEKPNAEKAQEYLLSGNYLWNGGMFLFPANVMMTAVQKHMPELYEGVQKIMGGKNEAETQQLLSTIFPSLPNVSIDYGVMEKEAHLAVLPCDFGWNDIGSWLSAWELSSKDSDGNHVPENAMVLNGKGNYIHDLRSDTSTKKLIALCGVSDLVVVETDNALLVLPREKSQDVKSIVEALKAEGKKEFL